MDLIDRVYGFSPYDVHIASYRGTLEGLPEFPTQARGIGATAFLKAPEGTVAEVHPVKDLSDQEVGLYTTAEAGDWSRPLTSYLARDGVLECFRGGQGASSRTRTPSGPRSTNWPPPAPSSSSP